MSARYEVCTIEGYPPSGSQSKSITHWIADSWYGFREVEWFTPSKYVHRVTARLRADDRCAKLNSEHDAWMRDNGYAPSVHRSVDTVDRP